TLRSKVRRMVGLEDMLLLGSSEGSLAIREEANQESESAPRPINLRLALDLIERASGEMTSVREQARAQRNVGLVLSAARQQVAAAGELVADLQEQLRESEEKAE